VINMRRFFVFVLIIVVTFVVMGITTPKITSDIKLGLDLKGGFEILYIAEPINEGQEITPDVLREAARSIEDRANRSKVAEPEVTPEGTDRIRVKLAGVENPEELRRILKTPAVLTFRGPDGTIEMRGDDFVENGAAPNFDPDTGGAFVSIKLKDASKFYEITQRLTGQRLAIYLDEEMISNPVVNGAIPGGTATITGMENFQEAEKLAGTINLGALPVNLTEMYTQSVGATLGKLSLEQTLRAGIIGSIIILLFMIAFYRIPGLVACFTLISYTWLLLLVFYWMKATLTLPGIAAFVLGIGMAVDANIITYERIKEEIRSGKTILSSLKAGSRNSLSTIIDANVTTILAGLVLFFVGTGAIQGFALILVLSIIVSIITNVVFSRFLLYLLIRTNMVKKPGYFGVKEAEISEL
jgi:preprotein translocase subunit SecD